MLKGYGDPNQIRHVFWKGELLYRSQALGFALPMAMGLGMVMLAFAGTSILIAQGAKSGIAVSNDVIA